MTWDNFTLVLAQDPASPPPRASDNQNSAAPTETTGEPGGQTLDPAAGNGTGTGGNANSFGGLWIWMLPLALVFIMLSMGGRKEKKKHAALMAALSKGDKVRTAGGILGTVVEVRDEEIIVKVDENANTRLRFSRSSISSILESKNGE